ncbi:MinD/ParA family protein [Ornithinibacillus halophilus]|uniref:Flagellar biosynthesis protein FlhG n=1 Tax=Ornithinibacillus halophilus TaxID=930117 RepID=A0A1M5CB81_9BACI|nr:MinD/ParA family protein [Ornithinibacillus halophilus]SHF51998.1 flagellar biosynthesis protein FlhG [Ornithinibacillus halophilus]
MVDQATSLRQKLQGTSSQRKTKVISFVSGKGGVGKSNVALNFSLELQKSGKSVLLIDLDIGMGNIEILQGVHAEKTIVDMFEEQLAFHEIVKKGTNNLPFISGGTGLTGFFHLNEEKMNFFYEQFHHISREYDYILFDLGANVSEESIFFILASDECVVVTTPEPTSITDAYSMVKQIISRQLDMPIYVILNRSYSFKYGLKTLERFKLAVKQFLLSDVHVLGQLPDEKFVSTSVRRQIPFTVLNKRAPISRAIGQIVLNYMSNESLESSEESFSFIKRLKKMIRER